MDRKLDAKLCKKYPSVFADRHASMQTTAMCWGFECGNGWYKLLDEAAKKLEPLCYITKPLCRASQVKEKFGTLRFYMTAQTAEMDAIIEEAERKSAVTCEQCGKKGKLRGGNWLYTACAPCAKKRAAK